jgi:teichoic acid transport system permease protein
LRAYLRDIWDRRDFVVTVPLGELRAQNQNTVLGSFWHLLNPLFLAGVYYLVFGVIFNAQRGIENYPAFLIIGIFIYTYTGKAATSGARTVVANVKLIQSINFPRSVLPIAAMLAEAYAQLPAVLTMLVLVWLTGGSPSLAWLLIVPALLVQSLFNLGLAFFAARLTFHFRDVQQLLPYLLRVWMYLSGLFYTAEFVLPRAGPTLTTVFKANPLYEYMTIARDALIGPGFDPAMWAAATAWAVVVFVAGFLFFRAYEAEYSLV